MWVLLLVSGMSSHVRTGTYEDRRGIISTVPIARQSQLTCLAIQKVLFISLLIHHVCVDALKRAEDAGSTYYVSTLPTLVRNWRASSASLKLFHLDSFKIKLTTTTSLKLL